MDPASLSVGIFSAVYQSYTACISCYDLYVDFKNFEVSYREVRMGLMLERYRLELWASLMQLDNPEPSKNPSNTELAIWRLFEMIFNSILSALQESHERMELLGQRASLIVQDDAMDHEMLQKLSLSAKGNPKLDWNGALRKVKYIVHDKKRMSNLLQQLRQWNDALEKMSSQLERQSLRRQLRTHFTTKAAAEMPQVRDAAALLEHRDIQQLACARLAMEEDDDLESHGSGRDVLDASFSLQLDSQEIAWQGSQFATDQPRALAMYRGEEVIVDWRASEDDAWRIANPESFAKRTESLTRILNQDLRPLDLSILQCVGYLNRSRSITGYAFRLPEIAKQCRDHVTLFDLITRERNPEDLPDLGDRFELAKALVHTMYELHSINWMHKNVSTRNIVFWSKAGIEDPVINRPYLLGFDISRPNMPFEVSERPAQRLDDDHYRHPDYRQPMHTHDMGNEVKWRSFKPSYDFYSLGVVLYEIGIWHNVSQNNRRHPTKPSLQTYNSDPQLIQKCLSDNKVKQLRRHTGRRYTDVVLACLDRGLDRFWEESLPYDATTRLQRYLRHVQAKIVDPLAICNA